MSNQTPPPADPVLVVGVLWESGGHVGCDWQITVHGAASAQAALDACQARSRVTADDDEVLYVTDWEVVDQFNDAPFSCNGTLQL